MDNVPEPVVHQRARNQLYACAVDRGVDNLQIGEFLNNVGAELKTLDVGEECVVDIGAYDLDKIFVALELDVSHVFNSVDMIDYIGVVGSDNLRAVSPVGLIAVIFTGIVAGGDVDAALKWRMANDSSGVGRKLSKR